MSTVAPWYHGGGFGLRLCIRRAGTTAVCLEACVARKLASSLYVAFNGKSAATGRGRAPPSLTVTAATAKHSGTIQLHPCFQCGASDPPGIMLV